MVQNPIKIQEKNSISKSTFLGPNNFSNFFWLHLVPGTTIEKTQVVPGTK